MPQIKEMLKVFLFAIVTLFALGAGTHQDDPAADQIFDFMLKTKEPIGTLTTSAGAPVEYNEAHSTLNTNLIRNEHFMQEITHLNRENIPDRIVHPKGTGAFGYFEATRDISHICKAKLFSKVGKRTPVSARLSMGVVRKGGPDVTREARGYSVKFHTEEGNFDIAGFNTRVFVTNEPLKFGTFAHAIKRNPATDLSDPNTLWDFLTLNPASLHMFLMVFSDAGIPDGYRRMSGHGIHTYGVYNATGGLNFVRFHFYPEIEMKTLNSSEALRVGSLDPDYCARDLYNAIANGDYPTWKVSIQIITPEDVKKSKYDYFDITRDIYDSDFPRHEIGRVVLNRNPKNYFSEVEQLAFCPANLIPGILGAPDKSFEARCLSYRDSQRYRLGVNFDRIQVNAPYKSKVLTYQRDGVSQVGDNQYDAPNYYPNSYNGPVPYEDENRPTLPTIKEKEANNFDQCRKLYLGLSYGERDRFVDNSLVTLCSARNFLQDRAIKVFRKIHPDLAKRTAKAMKIKKCRYENEK